MVSLMNALFPSIEDTYFSCSQFLNIVEQVSASVCEWEGVLRSSTPPVNLFSVNEEMTPKWRNDS